MNGHRLKVISLNIQHAWNIQKPMMALPLRRKKVLANLDNIANMLRRHTPDIVLLQEVDRISPLTRHINQIQYLARRVGYLYYAHGASSEMRVGGKIVYAAGCGIISRYPIEKVEHIKFAPCFPTPRKGFLVASIRVAPGLSITVVSTHLVPFNLLNARAKSEQIERMAEVLHDKRPLVVGGDFNSGIRGNGKKHLNKLASRLQLATHPAARERHSRTYPARRPRRKIDWILVSPDMIIDEYKILRDRVSDHLAIGTTVSL